MADYNVNMKQWNGTSFDNVLPLAYNAKQLDGKAFSDIGDFYGVEIGKFLVTNKGSYTIQLKQPCSCVIVRGQIYALGNYALTSASPESPTELIQVKQNNFVYTAVNTVTSTFEAQYIGFHGDMSVWVFTENGKFIPSVTGLYDIELHGGGGGGCFDRPDVGNTSTSYMSTGGGSGEIFKNVRLVAGTEYVVTIGVGGQHMIVDSNANILTDSSDGGATTFGEYRVAGGGRATKGVAGAGHGSLASNGVRANSATGDYFGGRGGVTIDFYKYKGMGGGVYSEKSSSGRYSVAADNGRDGIAIVTLVSKE